MIVPVVVSSWILLFSYLRSERSFQKMVDRRLDRYTFGRKGYLLKVLEKQKTELRRSQEYYRQCFENLNLARGSKTAPPEQIERLQAIVADAVKRLKRSHRDYDYTRGIAYLGGQGQVVDGN